jgi:hypothetical protein
MNGSGPLHAAPPLSSGGTATAAEQLLAALIASPELVKVVEQVGVTGFAGATIVNIWMLRRSSDR